MKIDDIYYVIQIESGDNDFIYIYYIPFLETGDSISDSITRFYSNIQTRNLNFRSTIYWIQNFADVSRNTIRILSPRNNFGNSY